MLNDEDSFFQITAGSGLYLGLIGSAAFGVGATMQLRSRADRRPDYDGQSRPPPGRNPPGRRQALRDRYAAATDQKFKKPENPDGPAGV